MSAHDDNAIGQHRLPIMLDDIVPALGPVSSGLPRGARRVFTPSAINTIRMAGQGKSASEIAEVIGSTAASVRVNCSHLKIKLRRQRQRGDGGQELVIYLRDADYVALERKAVHMKKSAVELSGELLEAIIRSDIFEAVLDDDK
jgi:DNA-binding CsgD family transcriptional regulator